MRLALAAPVLLCSACLTELPVLEDPCAAWDKPGLYKLTLDTASQGRSRAMVWMPSGAGPRPVVTMLHGSGQDDEAIRFSTQWIQLTGDQAVIVFPNGVGQSWNHGHGDDGGERRSTADDLAYLEDLGQTVMERTCGAGLLAAGFSNGALMTNRWACEGTQVDAAIPAAGAMLHEPGECQGPRPIRMYHGTNDNSVPFDGGQSRTGGLVFPSAEESIAVWQVINECADTEPEVTTDGDTTCRAWDCAAPTELCVMQGVGHVWPGGTNRKTGEHDATADGFEWFLGSILEDATVAR